MSTTTTTYGPLITSLESVLLSYSSAIATETNSMKLAHDVRSYDYVLASLASASAEQLMATATASQAFEQATEALSGASVAISSISLAGNLYGTTPSHAGNLAMTIVMGIFFIVHSGLGVFYQTWFFGISYFLGTAAEVAGYVGRLLGADNTSNSNFYLLQIITLTIAPCFIMAGIYFVFAQVIAVYDPRYAMLKPKRYSQIFITSDVVALLVQAIGGGMGARALKKFKSPKNGTHVMVAGLVLQVISMTVFLYLLVNFLWRIRYLRASHSSLEPTFNPHNAHIRQKKMFKVLPAAIFMAAFFVYVRCVYRVVELAEGWTGYLITHETYFMCLDALMMALACLTLAVFHPGHSVGKLGTPPKESPNKDPEAHEEKYKEKKLDP